MDMLRSASAWLAQARVDKLSETVMLQHFSDGEKSGAPVELHATRGRSLFRADDKYGVTIRVQSVDFIVPASELGNQFPEKGDEIYADGRVFEVLAPNDEPVWRWNGNFGNAVRIHTKDMGEPEEEETQSQEVSDGD